MRTEAFLCGSMSKISLQDKSGIYILDLSMHDWTTMKWKSGIYILDLSMHDWTIMKWNSPSKPLQANKYISHL